MARIRKRVTTRQNWDSDSMSNAVLAVINKSQTYREASATFNVPRSTLLRKVNTYILIFFITLVRHLLNYMKAYSFPTIIVLYIKITFQ